MNTSFSLIEPILRFIKGHVNHVFIYISHIKHNRVYRKNRRSSAFFCLSVVFIVVDQTSAHEDFSFLLRQRVERCVDDLYTSCLQLCRIQCTYICFMLNLNVAVQYMQLDFTCAASKEASDAFDVDIGTDRKRNILSRMTSIRKIR